MFRIDLLSIIRSLNTAFTAIGIFHTTYVDCPLARSGRTVNLSETRRDLYQNKVEKWSIFLAFMIRIYHDARSSERQTHHFIILLNSTYFDQKLIMFRRFNTKVLKNKKKNVVKM